MLLKLQKGRQNRDWNSNIKTTVRILDKNGAGKNDGCGKKERTINSLVNCFEDNIKICTC